MLKKQKQRNFFVKSSNSLNKRHIFFAIESLECRKSNN